VFGGTVGTVRSAGRARFANAALAALVLSIVAMMIVPLPTWLLDLLITSNLTLGLLMLLIALVVPDGLAFTSLPTVLLITTLYRLALNVSSTRLILLQADAGEVIRAFGQFVVKGDYVVGGVVFLILTLIQYVVVARGSERVAEVGARFTLDAMPGKQLAIDGDLRAGILDAQSARARRAALERESQFYGAMDGAMKFVKGDAIASILITLINLGAGLAIGIGSRGLGVLESLKLYGLLSIGDGLVSQIPSLLASTAAGVVVTRVASGEAPGSLGEDVSRQLFGRPPVLATAAGFLGVLSLVPGLPALPFLLIGGLLAVTAHGLRRVEQARGERAEEPGASELPELAALQIELGAGLARRLGVPALGGAPLQQAIARERRALFLALGLELPAVRVVRSAELPERGYVLSLNELRAAEGVLSAEADAAATLAGELCRLAGERASELLGLEQTQQLLDRLARSSPALVRHALPKPLSLPLLNAVLRRLLAEQVSVRPLPEIVEVLAARALHTSDAATLAEHVRERLARHIANSHTAAGVLRVHALDPLIEDVLRDSLRDGQDGRYLALAPDQAADILRALRGLDGGVLVTQPDLRRFVQQLVQAERPRRAVLSFHELPADLKVERGAPLTLQR
jgi:type III secretory pathway component EscV